MDADITRVSLRVGMVHSNSKGFVFQDHTYIKTVTNLVKIICTVYLVVDEGPT